MRATDEVFDGRVDALIMGRTGGLAPHAGGKAERRPGLDWRWVRAREQWQRTQSGGALTLCHRREGESEGPPQHFEFFKQTFRGFECPNK